MPARGARRSVVLLSAEHGLVVPDEWLAPYLRDLPDTPRSYRQIWGQWVVARLALLQGELRGRVVEVHASDEYVAAIRGPLTGMGAEMVEPLTGLSFGRRLSWYGDPATAQPDVGDVVASLMDSSSARTPAQFLGTKGRVWTYRTCTAGGWTSRVPPLGSP